MAKRATRHEPDVRLDNLNLAGKVGWQRFVNTAARILPESLTRKEREALGGEAFEDDRQRREWQSSFHHNTLAGRAARGCPRLERVRWDPGHW